MDGEVAGDTESRSMVKGCLRQSVFPRRRGKETARRTEGRAMLLI
jgi:hypothetical protein